jgi:hypothetical protein
MHILCSLIAIVVFGVIKASYPEPTFAARLQTSFQKWWNTPKPQTITQPVQEDLLLKQLDVAGEERDKAFEALKNIKRPKYKLQYSEILNKKNDFFNKQRAYENLGNKYYDSKLKELYKN